MPSPPTGRPWQRALESNPLEAPWHQRSSARFALPRVAGIAVLLSILACVSNGSPPPAPSPEASSEGQTLEPSAASTLPAPTPAQVSPSPSPSSPVAAPDLSRELSALPDNVLVGTDVVPLADYLASAAPVPQSGAFRSEQGGATAEVRIMRGPQGVTLTREFTEPETKAQTKRYDGLQARANGVRLSSANLEVLGMRQSLLVLEKHSGVDGIPDSLWIEYERLVTQRPAVSGGATTEFHPSSARRRRKTRAT